MHLHSLRAVVADHMRAEVEELTQGCVDSEASLKGRRMGSLSEASHNSCRTVIERVKTTAEPAQGDVSVSLEPWKSQTN